MTQAHKAWIVVFSGLGVNLSLGALYSWGTISAALIDQLKWSATQTQIPYMLASALFAVSMIPAGGLQDKLGPRTVLILSAVLAGTGFILSGFNLTVVGLSLFFGVIFGLAMGFGYASPSPAAIKWFHPKHRGVITGIVVSGFGLAPVYIAPLSDFLLRRYGLHTTFVTFGILFFSVLFFFSFLVKNPPAGHVPVELKKLDEKSKVSSAADKDYHQMLKSKQFYLIWLMFFCGTFAGLKIIGQMAKIGQEQALMENSFILVIIYAIFNFLGRIAWGTISDSIGRIFSLFLMFAIQVFVFLIFEFLTQPFTLLIGKSIVGFTFGGMLTVFPAITADYYGTKNLGVNYGLVITAWGAGGVLGPLLGGITRDTTGDYRLSYLISMLVSLAGVILCLLLKKTVMKERSANG
jgi:OFA family oxalate/formate antiporter-like MFS transporter